MYIDLDKIFMNERVTIVGGGPSLEGFNWNRLNQPVIAVNDSVYSVESKMLVAIDEVWIKRHTDKLVDYSGVKVSDKVADGWKRIIYTPNHSRKNLDWHCMKANLSGFTALALAFYLGAKSVVLLGYDGGYSGRSNYYENKGVGITSSSYEKANRLYDYFKPYPVVNVGEGSMINSFKKVPIESEFYVD